MALVCDIKSTDATPDQQQEEPSATNEDLEDGEIEDDEEETPAESAAPTATITTTSDTTTTTTTNSQSPPAAAAVATAIQQQTPPPPPPPIIRFGPQPHEKYNRDRRKHDDKKKTHLTEAEKHVMHLHKLERMEREKREKYRREQVVDDFASNIEKAIANVLKKERPNMNDDDKDDDKRQNRKRRKKEKERRRNEKQRRLDSPSKTNEENDSLRSLSQEKNTEQQEKQQQHSSPHSSHDDSNDSEYSSDNGRDRKHYQRGVKSKNRDRHDRKYNNRDRDRDRERSREAREARIDTQLKDTPSVCLFYLQGKCNKGDDCPYSHEVMLPMKLELCKFYQMECCAKGDKCLYMHSEFPCKFYHTGLTCPAGDNCKFAHGRPLSDSLKQILFKHIETAPREILGGFPRLNRDEVFTMINETQKALEEKKTGGGGGGGVSEDGKEETSSERKRNRPSRWQDANDSDKLLFSLKGFYTEQDQDLRVSAVNSNGDVDMRTLQLHPPILTQTTNKPENETAKQDVDIRNTNFMIAFNVETKQQDVDARQLTALASKDVDCRRLPYEINKIENEESGLQMDVDERKIDDEDGGKVDVPAHLPKKQRELFMRIQAQQKDATLGNQPNSPQTDDNNIDWYSDDDDDDRLMIKVDGDDVKERGENEDERPEPSSVPAPAVIKPVETVIEKLGDLSKIDISDAVTKLLSSISQSTTLSSSPSTSTAPPVIRDPRQGAQQQQQSGSEDATKSVINADPRRARVLSLGSPPPSQKTERLSIYEQGGLSVAELNRDIDLRMTEKDLDLRAGNFGDTDLRSAPGRSDIDLRQLSIPFKGIQNYTPASEIDASFNSHPPIPWKVHEVDIPRPDYTGLKLSIHDAQTTGDPRLRKIFRLSISEEKDSPASPKESPKAPRVDPRRRKMEEAAKNDTNMSYTQQLSLLQNSAFYQSLTSNQKLLLNQELAMRADQTGNNDAVLNGILTNLGLVSSVPPQTIGAANVSALSILTSVNNLGMLPQNAAAVMGQNQVNPNILAHNPNLMNQLAAAQGIVQQQPGLLGAAPGIPNMPPINFDPRNGGLLGNAPAFGGGGGGGGGPGGGAGGGYNDNNNFGFNNDEFYPDNNGFRNERNFNRDGRGRRGGRNNFNRNMRKFRNMNRNQRGHTPP